MFLLFISMALTPKQQRQHDITEWNIYHQMRTEEDAIADIWRPSAKLLADYRSAKSCYVRFHLYQTPDCSVELRRVEADLGDVERTDGQ